MFALIASLLNGSLFSALKVSAGDAGLGMKGINAQGYIWQKHIHPIWTSYVHDRANALPGTGSWAKSMNGIGA